MTDAAPQRRARPGGPDDGGHGRPGGGRAARHAHRAAQAHAQGLPFLTRTLKPFEVLDEEGLALIALLSAAARTEIEGVVRRVEKIETAVEPRFQAHFVEAMAFPHKTADFPNLARVVPLPPRSGGGAGGVGGEQRTQRRRRPVAAGTREDA